jgi:hypothetical protein
MIFQSHESPILLLSLALLLAACQPAATPATTPPITPQPTLATTSQPSATYTLAAVHTPTTAKPSANADVLRVQAVQSANGTWTFHVTVQHPDTGWEDYADGWDVLTLDGTILKPNPDDPFTRLLLHPHENEQPFTRSQSNIAIPPDVTQVRVRAHDIVDGYGGREVLVDLTTDSGPDFEVERTP